MDRNAFGRKRGGAVGVAVRTPDVNFIPVRSQSRGYLASVIAHPPKLGRIFGCYQVPLHPGLDAQIPAMRWNIDEWISGGHVFSLNLRASWLASHAMPA